MSKEIRADYTKQYLFPPSIELCSPDFSYPGNQKQEDPGQKSPGYETCPGCGNENFENVGGLGGI